MTASLTLLFLLNYSQGYHLTRPANCPDFVYAIMKDCWIREPEKRVGFKTISMQLKNSNHNYDAPQPSEGEDGPAQVETTESGNR